MLTNTAPTSRKWPGGGGRTSRPYINRRECRKFGAHPEAREHRRDGDSTGRSSDVATVAMKYSFFALYAGFD
jgi:hypothetical protein